MNFTSKNPKYTPEQLKAIEDYKAKLEEKEALLLGKLTYELQLRDKEIEKLKAELDKRKSKAEFNSHHVKRSSKTKH